MDKSILDKKLSRMKVNSFWTYLITIFEELLGRNSNIAPSSSKLKNSRVEYYLQLSSWRIWIAVDQFLFHIYIPQHRLSERSLFLDYNHLKRVARCCSASKWCLFPTLLHHISCTTTPGVTNAFYYYKSWISMYFIYFPYYMNIV